MVTVNGKEADYELTEDTLVLKGCADPVVCFEIQ